MRRFLLLPTLALLGACAPRSYDVGAGDAVADHLAGALVPGPGARCAYERLGGRADTLYVWALCLNAAGSGVSAPAVVALGPGGAPASHRLPRDGSRYADDVRALFPRDVQRQVFVSGRRQNERHDVLVATLTTASHAPGGEPPPPTVHRYGD